MKINENVDDFATLKEIGKRIREKRIELSFSQKSLATKAGISIRCLSNIENGMDTSFSKIISICRVLNCYSNLDLLVPKTVDFESINRKKPSRKRFKQPIKKQERFVWGEDR